MKRSEAAFRVVGLAGSALLRVVGRTFRFRVEGAEAFRELRRQGRPVIFAFWHSRILPLAYLHRGEGVVVLVSRHADGEYITRVVSRLGFGVARGSSTRGGARGLRELVRHLRSGGDVAITPDGPRGPARRFKAGALLAAQLTEAPVVPVAAGSPSAWRLGSWDRFLIPGPFARFRVRYGTPHFVPRELGDGSLETHARILEDALNRLTDEVDGVGPEGSPPGEERPRSGAGKGPVP